MLDALLSMSCMLAYTLYSRRPRSHRARTSKCALPLHKHSQPSLLAKASASQHDCSILNQLLLALVLLTSPMALTP